ncbi:hypothetical protein KC19_7G089200 [Ceratodon purpureus]|uniref:Uncharacterized protein n=1 Tax=Ceratodon purpureus TaxID=3225 RepID=A0A8T0H6E3_CERPU|nr:hypothetical protein KC19_7G089200 [Ceratodon purpureus]
MLSRFGFRLLGELYVIPAMVFVSFLGHVSRDDEGKVVDSSIFYFLQLLLLEFSGDAEIAVVWVACVYFRVTVAPLFVVLEFLCFFLQGQMSNLIVSVDGVAFTACEGVFIVFCCALGGVCCSAISVVANCDLFQGLGYLFYSNSVCTLGLESFQLSPLFLRAGSYQSS